MKKILVCLGFFVSWSTVFAYIPTASVTKMAMPVYGIYVTSDPTCLTGLVAARPLSATPTDFDFASGASLGTFSAPADGINCVIFVAKSAMTIEWTGGTYTSTSRFGASTFSDASCSVDGSVSFTDTKAFTCLTGRSKTIVWPDQIITDMVALGIDYETDDCMTARAGNIAPIYVSSYSKCAGDTAVDETIGGACDWSLYTSLVSGGYRANTVFKNPTASDDATAGVKLGTVTKGKSKYKFVVTPMVGGTSTTVATSNCGVMGPPLFSFTDAE